MKTLKVTVDGTVYEVTLESAGAAEASSSPAPATESAAPAAAGDNVVLCPLAATVVGIEVSVGQTVKEGDRLFTLEAMKMNSYVTAEKAGKVAAVLVEVSDQVGEGQPLLKLA
jgi:biotin carboxyl carrier protein